MDGEAGRRGSLLPGLRLLATGPDRAAAVDIARFWREHCGILAGAGQYELENN